MRKKRNTVEFEVSGDRAMFSDPITRVGGEKSSYYVPTYESLKGILMSVYFKPTIIWIIDAARIMNPIQTISEAVCNKRYHGGKDLAIYTYLKNVRYQVRAHFIWNENRPELADDRNENKHHNIAKRMIERGGRRDVFLGTRECHADVSPCVFGQDKGAYDDIETLSLGYMFHGFTYADEAVREKEKGHVSTRFSHVVMRNGIIEFPAPDDIPDKDIRILHKMQIKRFGEEYKNFIGLKEFADEGVGQ